MRPNFHVRAVRLSARIMSTPNNSNNTNPAFLPDWTVSSVTRKSRHKCIENHIYESSLRKFHRQKTEHVWNSNVNRVPARRTPARVSYCHKFPPRKAANRIWIGVLSHDKFHDKFEAVNQLSRQRRSIRPRTNRSGIILENVAGCESSGKSLEKVDPWNAGTLETTVCHFRGNIFGRSSRNIKCCTQK